MVINQVLKSQGSGIDISSLEKYVLLPGRTHDNYVYGTTLVEIDPTIQGEDFEGAVRTLHNQDSYLLTLRQFIDIIELLRSGEASLGSRTPIDAKGAKRILEKLLGKRRETEIEWFNTSFESVNRQLFVNYGYEIRNNLFLPKNTAPLEHCLMEDKETLVSLNLCNRHGLPTIIGQEVGYTHPIKGSMKVAAIIRTEQGSQICCTTSPVNKAPEYIARRAILIRE